VETSIKIEFNDYLSNKYNLSVYLLRLDLIYFGGYGSKAIKIRTLLEEKIIPEGIKNIFVIGSAASNNVLGWVRICKEFGINCIPCIKIGLSEKIQPNYEEIKKLIPESQIVEIQTTNYVSEISRINNYILLNKIHNYLIIPEGTNQETSIQGLSIINRNVNQYELNENIRFKSVFIDAGTGVTASSFVNNDTQVREYYITIIAGKSSTMEDLIHKDKRDSTRYLKPIVKPKFGHGSLIITAYSTDFKQKTGIYPDKIYTAKHLMTIENLLSTEKNKLGDPILVFINNNPEDEFFIG